MASPWLKKYDGDFAARLADVGSDVLRYVGVIDVAEGTAKVELRRYSKDHPFSNLQDIENICLFSTERFTPQPLQIRA